MESDSDPDRRRGLTDAANSPSMLWQDTGTDGAADIEIKAYHCARIAAIELLRTLAVIGPSRT